MNFILADTENHTSSSFLNEYRHIVSIQILNFQIINLISIWNESFINHLRPFSNYISLFVKIFRLISFCNFDYFQKSIENANLVQQQNIFYEVDWRQRNRIMSLRTLIIWERYMLDPWRCKIDWLMIIIISDWRFRNYETLVNNGKNTSYQCLKFQWRWLLLLIFFRNIYLYLSRDAWCDYFSSYHRSEKHLF